MDRKFYFRKRDIFWFYSQKGPFPEMEGIFFVVDFSRLGLKVVQAAPYHTTRNISKEMTVLWSLSDVSNKSQKNCLCNVFKTSWTYLKKCVYSLTSLRCVKNISRKYLWFFKNTPQKWFSVVSAGLLKYLIKSYG